jgi:hypothetical protein
MIAILLFVYVYVVVYVDRVHMLGVELRDKDSQAHISHNVILILRDTDTVLRPHDNTFHSYTSYENHFLAWLLSRAHYCYSKISNININITVVVHESNPTNG